MCWLFWIFDTSFFDAVKVLLDLELPYKKLVFAAQILSFWYEDLVF